MDSYMGDYYRWVASQLKESMLKTIKLEDDYYIKLISHPCNYKSDNKSVMQTNKLIKKDFNSETGVYKYEVTAPGIKKDSLKANIKHNKLKVKYSYPTSTDYTTDYDLDATLPFNYSYKSDDGLPKLTYEDGIIKIEITDNSDSVELTL